MKKSFLWIAAPLIMAFLVGCEPLEEEGEGEGSDESSEDVTGSTDSEDNGVAGSAVGLPDADSFSLAVESAVVTGALDTDGVTVQLSVQVGDRHNHPVADETAISFWTEYGRVQEFCLTTNGSCSVTWTSGGGGYNGVYKPQDGLSTIMAFTIGEDSYFDAGERNGIYNVDSDSDLLSSDEAILSTPELYYDRNFDGFTASSFTDLGSGLTIDNDAFVDLDESGSFTASSAKFRGTDCSAAAISEGHCGQDRIHVWDKAQLVLSYSADAPTITVSNTSPGLNTAFTVSVTDSNGNYPSEGTTINITPDVTDADFKVNFPGGDTVLKVGSAGKSAAVFNAEIIDGAGGGTNPATIEIDYLGLTYSTSITY
ncbi:hypothetical protein KO489_12265 [Reinekea forsetii]|nr:hypothetical protein [Reinekea forsetii]